MTDSPHRPVTNPNASVRPHSEAHSSGSFIRLCCLLAAFLFSISLAFQSGCTKDGTSPDGSSGKSTDPQPACEPEYRVLHSYDSPDGEYHMEVRHYSIPKGTVEHVDVYEGPWPPFHDAAFSPGGALTCYTRQGVEDFIAPATWITNTRSGDTLALNSDYGGRYAAFSPDGQYVAMSGGHRLVVMRSSDLVPIMVDTTEYCSEIVFSPVENTFVTKQWSTDCLLAFTIQNDHVLQPDSVGVYYGCHAFSPDGSKILATSRCGKWYLQIIDMESKELISKVELGDYSCISKDMSWRPGTSQLYLVWSYFDFPEGGVGVYDAVKHEYSEYATEADFPLLSYERFLLRFVQFDPLGKTMILSNGGLNTSSIWFVDVDTKELVGRVPLDSIYRRTDVLKVIPIDYSREANESPATPVSADHEHHAHVGGSAW